MSTLTLTVSNVNGNNVATAYSKGFSTEKLVDFYANANSSWTGNTIVSYRESDDNARVDIYVVTETVAYITALTTNTDNIVSVKVPISAAEIATGNTTPIAVVAALGTGKYASVIGGVIEYTYNTGAYTTATDIDLVTTTTGTIVATAATGIAGSANKVTRFIPVAGVIQANEGLSFKVKTANPTVTTGIGTAVIKLKYIVL